ncbi:glycosyltransferase [Enterocloster aldenensis]|nr:glycosyltransferase [Enterocloster aldenensis]
MIISKRGEIVNILHISPYLPSLKENHAGGVCMGKEIETLRSDNNVYVLSFIVTNKDMEIAKELSNQYYYLHRLTKFKRILSVLSHPLLPPLFSARSTHKFIKDINLIIKTYNIHAVHAEYASMGQYLIYIKKHYPHIKCVLVEHDFTEQSYQRKIINASCMFLRIFYIIQLKQIHYYEKKYCKKADVVLTFNDKDNRLLTHTYKLTNVRTINPFYGIENVNPIPFHNKNVHLCFVGQMGRSENDKAALRLIEIYSRVKKVIPNLKLSIIGNNPSSKIKSYEDNMIRITGFVENIDDEISRCLLGVFPLTEGAGIKLKVLRSLALGIPVITTSVGAEGIDPQGTVLKIAETDDEFEMSIISALSDKNKLEKWSQKGIDYVQKHFAWDKSESILKDLYS